MIELKEVLGRSAAYLEERKISQAKRIAEDLLAASLKLKRIDLYMQYDRPLVEEELCGLRDALKRCGKGEPLEYVLGVVEFLDCRIAVDSRALIPRPETEIMADLIVKKLKEESSKKVCWDLCTGSGCLGISVKKAIPELCMTLSDLSSDALDLAKKNACENGVDVDLRLGDLFEPFGAEKADVILCNPPYLSTNEYLEVDDSVSLFEPKMALVGGERGTELYEKIAAELSERLNENGLAFFEIGYGQGDALKKIFAGGPWVRMEVKKDWAGHDRFFFLEKQ